MYAAVTNGQVNNEESMVVDSNIQTEADQLAEKVRFYSSTVNFNRISQCMPFPLQHIDSNNIWRRIML